MRMTTFTVSVGVVVTESSGMKTKNWSTWRGVKKIFCNIIILSVRLRDEIVFLRFFFILRQFKPDAPANVKQFLEREAELSDDDYRGSGDEDEDGLDQIRQEDLDFQDNRHFSMTKQQRENIPEYL